MNALILYKRYLVYFLAPFTYDVRNSLIYDVTIFLIQMN